MFFFSESGGIAPGDIMWARIGNHPYWPSLISLEPEKKEFKKGAIVWQLPFFVLIFCLFISESHGTLRQGDHVSRSIFW